MDNLKDKDEKDNFDEYVRLKVAKLSAAAYLVTNFLPDQEPLKWGLRKWAIKLKQNSGEKLLFGELVREIEQVLSLIDLAMFCAGVSKMNLSVLQTEYLSLRQALLQKHEMAEQMQIAPTPEIPKITRNSPISRPNSDNHRQALILDLIKHKGSASIRDIALGVKNVSSKTVQRELAHLVRTGVLRKEGEKRWSRYSLAS